jgi:hypothetical protein
MGAIAPDGVRDRCPSVPQVLQQDAVLLPGYTMGVYLFTGFSMNTPKAVPFELTVFKSGNSAALRLPKALGFEPGERVVAYRDGEALVLKHTDSLGWPIGYFDTWEASSIELPDRSQEGSRETRLKRLFGEQERF